MKGRRRLFAKYVVVLVVLVSGAVLTSGLVELFFSYRENKAALVAIEREKAVGAAARIGGFVEEIERQVGWTILPRFGPDAGAMEPRRFDYLRLLRQVPPITEVSYLDGAGHEQLRVSRLAMDVMGGGADLSGEAKFRRAKADKVYHGPVYFRKESEPYMTIAVAGAAGDPGVTVVEVNLKFILDVVSQIKVGKAGRAYVVDSNGILIAHPDISLVLQKTSLATLPQVHAAVAGRPSEDTTIAWDLRHQAVLTAFAPIATLRWFVFVEQPTKEAFQPLQATIERTALLILVGILLSVVASVILARKMVTPIRTLEAGAARLGAGALTHRIDVRTGDELEALGERFNSMAEQLQESYAGLERKVDERTRELTEALEQQTATAEILRVISGSPTDLKPVMDAVVQNAARLCDAVDCQMLLVERDTLRVAASFGNLHVADAARRGIPIRRDFVTGRAVLDRRTVHVHDLAAEIAEFPAAEPLQRATGQRTTLATPLLREGLATGVMLIRRLEVRPFTDKQIALLETFADQAVIAIENVRLFTELQEKNRAVTEALEQQTATAEILRVISSSPTDLQPVFDTIVKSAVRLLGAFSASLTRLVGDELHLAALTATTDAGDEQMRQLFPVKVSDVPFSGQAVRDRAPVWIADTETDPRISDRMRAVMRARGSRSLIWIPMIREGQVIGVFSVGRREPASFTPEQIALLQTFADQAVIAVENVRLFQELQERTDALSRSVDELRALGEVGQAVSSTLDLETVLETIVSRASELSRTDGGAIYEYDQAAEEFHLRATQNFDADAVEALRARPIRKGEGALGRVAETQRPCQVADILADHTYQSRVRDVLMRIGSRAVLAVPLLREDQIIGGLVVHRSVPGEFDAEVIDLLTTFATQSALAIQNARLFREIDDKSRQLEVANRHKSEFLANMSHELRTPLNAIIGFSEVLLERMFGELNDKQAEYLDDILSSGRHLLSLINDILDLSKVEAGRMELDMTNFDLPQAVENAVALVKGRAAAHAIHMDVAVDERLGDFAGDERKFKQILLNLLSNAVKFTPDGGRVAVTATAADGTVEIAVRDTGIGIAPEDQSTIFEEFRQASSGREREGTGLGLALAKKFVELHGGTIRVKSAVGEGATFIVTLPVRPWPTS